MTEIRIVKTDLINGGSGWVVWEDGKVQLCFNNEQLTEYCKKFEEMLRIWKLELTEKTESILVIGAK